MRNLQWAGIVASLAMASFSILRHRRHAYSRLNLLIGLLISLGLLGIALYPPIIDPIRDLLMMQNRWFSVIFVAIVVLFGIYLSTQARLNEMNRRLGELVRALALAEVEQEQEPVAGTQPLISVVIPAYNEERAIRGVLQHLPSELLGHVVEPIVVVDGGEDNTEAIVRKEGHLVAPHRVNRGQGDALRTGFAAAFSRGARIVMTMDADGQHQAADMPSLVQPVISGEADYVMGSRFLGEYEESGGWRHAGIVFFTKTINLLGGVHLTDCTNGFRAIRASSLEKLDLNEDRFNAPELIMEAANKGLRIVEVPVTILKRAAGESKKPPRLGYPLGFLATIIRTWLR
jgi:hypothetical protein